MINCGFFYESLIQRGINFLTGVPDSILKDFCSYISDHSKPDRHIIAANEGGAIALACGHYLATGQAGLVYMQNSGQGNAVNPLISLANTETYSIPMLILIGWRGEPGKDDQPQHIKQGKITLDILDTLGISYNILPSEQERIHELLDWVVETLRESSAPVALVVRKNTFEQYRTQDRTDSPFDLSREEAIKTIVDNMDESAVVVSTTGKASRELYEYREFTKASHDTDFLNVGSMGHCSQIALAVAISKPDRSVYCLDGDGAVIMHMGAMAITGSSKAKNLKHIILNNACHDSVGGQPTCGHAVSFTGIAKSCGYTLSLQAKTATELVHQMQTVNSTDGPVLLEVMIRGGSRKDLGRPKCSLKESKSMFMEFLAR